jgi:hypothetical protein
MMKMLMLTALLTEHILPNDDNVDVVDCPIDRTYCQMMTMLMLLTVLRTEHVLPNDDDVVDCPTDRLGTVQSPHFAHKKEYEMKLLPSDFCFNHA